VQDWFEKGLEHIWLPYSQMKTTPIPAPVVGTEGVRFKLADKRELIDGVASWWAAVHGYNHPVLVGAAKEQLDDMPHIMLGGLAHEQAYKLAAKLAEITPGDLSKVFLTESGSVAVEVAMKIAVQYWLNAHKESRPKFISFKGGYHGDTFATMSVCDPEEGMHSLFKGVLADQHIVDLPENNTALEAIETLLKNDKSVAGVLIEPLIQGACGMQMHDAVVLKSLRKLCDQYGVLLIFDEIFTGFGRTGGLFAAENADVVPDIMTLGKALTGGIAPLAATIASRRVYEAFHDHDPIKALMHGPTFTGHAVGSAVANASIDLFEEEPRFDQIKRISESLTAGLVPLVNNNKVADVRICGAVGAVEMREAFDIDAARAWFIEQGVFIRPLGNVVYLTPAYVIEAKDLRRLIDAIALFVESI